MRYSPKQLATALYELLAEKPEAHKQTLVHFATYIQKIGAARMLSDIERHFENIRLQKENVIKVKISTAEKNQPIFPEKISGKKVELAWHTDQSLIAGAIIQIGDMRIDNSIKGRLENLKQVIS
ncbi:MAG: F0F1 ATP synthase subunit delta [Candidatus Paceibacterota bacterium]|jgi:F0F1-type ATP synthase delta subunit